MFRTFFVSRFNFGFHSFESISTLLLFLMHVIQQPHKWKSLLNAHKFRFVFSLRCEMRPPRARDHFGFDALRLPLLQIVVVVMVYYQAKSRTQQIINNHSLKVLAAQWKVTEQFKPAQVNLLFCITKTKYARFYFLSFCNICMHLRVSFDRALVCRKRTNEQTAKFWTEKCAHFFEKYKLETIWLPERVFISILLTQFFFFCASTALHTHTRARPVIAIIISQRENNSIPFFRKQKLRFVCVLFYWVNCFLDQTVC